MAQIRIEKTNKFTQLENKMLQDNGLSLRARGLLAYMLSLPADWDYSLTGLASKCREGKSALRSAMNELIDAGYVVRHLMRKNGVLDGYEYVVYETPHQSCENQTTDFQTTENQPSENRTEQIYNQTKKQETKKPPKAPRGGRRGREAKEQPDWKPERFTGFWAYYPRGEAKQAAIRAWDKLQPSDKLIDTMAQALKRQAASEDWQKGVGIPYASTWLNQRRWTDEQRAPSAGQAPAERVVEEEGAHYL